LKVETLPGGGKTRELREFAFLRAIGQFVGTVRLPRLLALRAWVFLRNKRCSVVEGLQRENHAWPDDCDVASGETTQLCTRWTTGKRHGGLV
jgi:hypothetical protein